MGLIKAYNGDMPYIFISYSHKDTDIVLQMVSQMQDDGYRVWYDEGIKPGTEWDDYIASKINGSSYFIAFLSTNYLNSSNCKDEMNYARDHVENILLVYLEPVELPSGMEMRFGRTQAILAYNYEVKHEFFNKLYLSKDIGLCKGMDVSGIVEESLENIPTETYAPVSDVMPKMTRPVEPEPTPVASVSATATKTVSETIIPEIKVERVPVTESRIKDKKLMWIILAAAAVLVIALVVIGIVMASRNKKDDKPETDTTAKTEREADDDSNKDSDKDSDADSNVDKTSESTESVAGKDSEETSDATKGDEIIQNVYSTYGLSVGESTYTMNDTDFYLKTDVPTFYDIEKQEYTDGTFYGTFAMNLMLPATSDYTELLHVRWIHVEPDGSEKVVADFTNIQPTSDEGVNWYELFLSTIDMGGEIPTGDYYVIVFAGDSEEEALISRVEYKESNSN